MRIGTPHFQSHKMTEAHHVKVCLVCVSEPGHALLTMHAMSHAARVVCDYPLPVAGSFTEPV